MAISDIKIGVKIGVAAALAIILFQVSNLLLVYKYFKFDYYITAIAILFLIAGFLISRHQQTKIKPTVSDDLLQNLTNKELAILQMIAEGKSNKEIASENYVEISTVKTHINNIYSKLVVRNRREAIGLVREWLIK